MTVACVHLCSPAFVIDISRNDFQTTLRINFHFANFKQLNVKCKRIYHKHRVKSPVRMSGSYCGGLNEPLAAFIKEIGCAASYGNSVAYPSAGNIL